MEIDLPALGERIREVRGGLTQSQFAERLGLERKTVSRYEAGERAPDALALVQLMSEFGVDLAWLLTGDGEGLRLTADERELLALFRSASLGVKAAAIGALQAGIHGGAPRASVTRMGNQAPGSVQVAHVGGSVHVREARKKPGM
ncbi:MAG TPA: helix-turn-helix transcriptional regulator [Pseudomonas sp.]|nr:helix-turn-helix transcriptional regulator [Pseudomonas sp.]